MVNNNVFNKLAIEKVKTQSDYLANKIKKMIISGELSGGSVFPNENDLSKKLNVGRGTLREAYTILETEGYIQRTKNGTSVRGRDEIAQQGNLKASLELADFNKMIEFVCVLEPAAVYIAAKNITDSQLAELKSLMDACENATDDLHRFLQLNYEIHSCIRNASENHLIISALIAYYNIFEQHIVRNIYFSNYNNDEFRKESLQQHSRLFDALEKRDADLAKAIMLEHLHHDVDFGLKNFLPF